MKTGLGLLQRYRLIFAYYNLLRFWIRRLLIGFDFANLFLQRLDKQSVLLILKDHGAQIGSNCDIETGLIFHNCNDYSNLIIGDNCHIGKNCFFDLRNKVIIGANVVISMQSSFLTHIDMSKSELRSLYPAVSKSIKVLNNVYIGSRSIILMGVVLDENSIVAAGSLVKDNVASRTLVGGVPAKKIKDIDL